MKLSENYEKYMGKLKETPKSKKFPLDLISKKISILKMFIEIINKHPEDLEESYSSVVEERKIEPAMQLNEYVILEIRNFYHEAYKKFGHTINYPSSAEKTGIVKEIRDNAIGHFLTDNPVALIELFEKVNNYGLQKIYDEWIQFRDFLFSKLNKE